jgi:fatty acid-binding protein DegV
MGDQQLTTNSNQQSTSPQSSQQESHSFTEDLQTVRKVGGFVVLLIASSNISAFVAKLQSANSSSLDIAGVASILNFYFATFPLTTFATIAGLVGK